MKKTIRITIEDPLWVKIDQESHRRKMTRSQFIRKALEDALHRVTIAELEQRQAEGYRRQPVRPGEFDDWESWQP